jgi:hypothetical protein
MEGGERTGVGGVGEGGVPKTPDKLRESDGGCKAHRSFFCIRCNGASSSPNLHSLLFSRSFDV